MRAGDWVCDACSVEIGKTRENLALTLSVQSPPNTVADPLYEELKSDGMIEELELAIYGDSQRQRVELCYECWRGIVLERDPGRLAAFVDALNTRSQVYR